MADLEQVVNDLNLASQSLQELREKYDGALDLLDNKNTEITGALESAKSNALQEVQTASDTAISQISELKDTSLNLVNEAKNTAIEEVNNAVSGIDTSKEEALLAIEQAKAAQEEKITALEQAKENIITELSEKTKLLTQNLEWTVGVDGKFTDLQEAIEEAKRYNPFKFTITIKIKDDYVFDKRINFNNYSFCNLNIASYNPDNIFNIDLSSGILFNLSRCKGVYINLKLKNTNTSNEATAIESYLGSELYFNGEIDGFNIGLNAGYNSIIYAPLSEINIKNSITNGIKASSFSRISIPTLNIVQTQGMKLKVEKGSMILCPDATLTGSATDSNQTFEQWTKDGYIGK